MHAATAKMGPAIFFMMFIIIGSFFFISLFVGVVFDNFVKLRDEEMGLGMLTSKQKLWVIYQSLALKIRVQKTRNSY